jgi:hypothetical protein
MSARMLYQRRGSSDSESRNFVCFSFACATGQEYSGRSGHLDDPDLNGTPTFTPPLPATPDEPGVSNVQTA